MSKEYRIVGSIANGTRTVEVVEVPTTQDVLRGDVVGQSGEHVPIPPVFGGSGTPLPHVGEVEILGHEAPGEE